MNSTNNTSSSQEKILVLNLEGSAGQFIARRVRDAGVYSEVVDCHTPLSSYQDASVKGIICCGRSPGAGREDAPGVDGVDSAGVSKYLEGVMGVGIPVLNVGQGIQPQPDDIQNFLFDTCGCRGDWKMETFAEVLIEDIRRQVGEERVIGALSGGVDSSVAAVLVHKAIGDRLSSVFVDNGLLRHEEAEQVMETLQGQLGLHVIKADARKRFLDRLAGVSDPEAKRKIIGEEFIYVFRDETINLSNQTALDTYYLLQGTIYPDIIESGTATTGVVKSHHNVGGIPKDMPFKGLVEPLRMLFKDEVRRLGEVLGIPREMVWRQPFPGPGLGIRVIGAVTEEKLAKVRLSDAILREEIAAAGLDKEIWQYVTVLPGVRSVGVTADKRSYDEVIAIRAVISTDAMTADWAELPYPVLRKISGRIVAEVPGVNRVVYDVTEKPPGTIEWE
jgi:GMP synthase (glutamine-hydrolysing)